MLGRTHALCGVAAWLGTLDAVGAHLGPVELVVSTAVATGGALLPDTDHPQASFAWTLPPVTRWLAERINRWSGGHRHGTHTLLALSVVGAAVALLNLWRPFGIVVAAVVGAIGVRALVVNVGRKHVTVLFTLAVMVGIGATIAAGHLPLMWLAPATSVGYAAHLAGDLLTSEGLYLLKPFAKQRIALPIIRPTGSKVERIPVTVALWILIAAAAYPLIAVPTAEA